MHTDTYVCTYNYTNARCGAVSNAQSHYYSALSPSSANPKVTA